MMYQVQLLTEVSMWTAINYVTSGFALIAFLAAAAAWAYKLYLEGRGRLIRSAKEKERGELVKNALEFFNIDAARLTKEQQFKLALEQIKSRGRRFTIQAAVLVVVALCITFYLIVQYAPMGQMTGVDSALVGKWESVGIVDSNEIKIRFDIGADGSFSRWYISDDEGVIEAEQSKLQAKSTTGVIPAEVKAVGSDGLIVMLGSGRSIELKRVGRITEPLDDLIVGRWKGTKLMDGASWDVMIEISPQHNYRYHAETRDNGKLFAQNGSYQMISRWSVMPIFGTYQVIADKPELELFPFNTIELKRSR
jgi:hypothetical protein